MDYREFCARSTRKDVVANDNVHFFAKRFSKPVAFACHKLGMSPNGVTFLFLVAGFLSAVMFYQGCFIFGYLLWRSHIVLDMADGDVARATKVFSANAVGFDRSNHIIINTSVMFAFASYGVDYILVCALVVSFYLYYFFSRNFSSGKAKTRMFSVRANLAKNIVGFEGFLLSSFVFLYFFSDTGISFVFLLYSIFFFILFFIKLRFRLKEVNS